MNLKKILAGVLACCVVGGALPSVVKSADNAVITAFAADYTEGTKGVLTYHKYADHIEITRCDESATTVVIPAKIDGVPVTSIGDEAFSYCYDLTEITIPDSVTNIGDMAFFVCKNLTSITIPDSVTSIGMMVFAGTPWLENKQKENPLVIVNNILIDGKTCSGDIDIIIPDSVASIGYEAFSGCESLTSITIPDFVTYIDFRGFGDCKNLISITILNPECEIYDSSATISNYHDVFVMDYVYPGVIKGYNGSTAEAYAEKYNRKFVALSSEPEIAMGDVNGDDTIDSSDATNVLVDYSLTSTGKESQLTKAQKAAADVDNDGKIDSSDASFILQFYAYSATGGTETDMSKWMENN